ncbi:MAG: alcohol dehydrogenase, partial [Chloroflexi bacterium]
MALPDTYRKVVATKFTTNFREAAAIVEEPLPTPEADEVLVRNLYAGVNATDVNVSAGLYTPGAQPPIDLGLEVLGEVVAVGDGVEHLQVGMPIIGMYTGAGYREYSIHKAAHVLPVPEPKPEYMALLLSGMTAAVGLNVTGEMKSGETVLVTAAAGGTGQIAVQLAKMAGNHVIGTCSTEEKAAFLRELGCDRVINYRQEDFATVIQEEYPNKLDIVYESVGRQMFDVALDNLAVRGRLVIIGAIAEYVSGPEVVNSPRIWT